tara:strand:- start:23 stop:718 length:696 start_codon:yes stop_codon:yes gene_type:complete
MNSYIKAWITNFIFIQAFFIFNVHSEEIAHPTYSDFLEKFPNGYPKFIGIGNPKSIGAFKLYLEELGYLTFEHDGNSIGFKYYVSRSKENSKSKDKITSETNGKLLDNLTANEQSEILYNNNLKANFSRDKYLQTILISQWVEKINNQIKKIIKYPKISKDRNQSGRVLISISLKSNGSILKISLETSSGFSALDEATINSIKKIKSFKPAPFESDHKVHTFILPVNYILE